MGKKPILIIIGAIFLGAVLLLLVNQEETKEDVVSKELEKLPLEKTINQREIIFDTTSLEAKGREFYAALPYQIEIGEETRLIESEMELIPGETPIEFTERFLEKVMPESEELEAYPEEMYSYEVSLHRMPEELATQYPDSDDPEAEPARKGISVYVRGMQFPDDSIGGNETRFDFIPSRGENWIFVWQGERVFCRRPDQEFWQPANELCP